MTLPTMEILNCFLLPFVFYPKLICFLKWCKSLHMFIKYSKSKWPRKSKWVSWCWSSGTFTFLTGLPKCPLSIGK